MSTITKIISTFLLLPIMLATASPQVASANVDEMLVSLETLEETLLELQSKILRQVKGVEVTVVTNSDELFDALVGVSGGETILLAPGHYGSLGINSNNYIFANGRQAKISFGDITNQVTIKSQNNDDRAIFDSVRLKDDNWKIENLSIRPTSYTAIEFDGEGISIIGNDISWGDASSWNEEEWETNLHIQARGIKGISTGSGAEVAYNFVKNVRYGIAVGGHTHVHHNVVKNFSADAMRANGDNNVVEHNVLVNAANTSNTHRDMVQSFTKRSSDGTFGTFSNGVIRNNTMIGKIEDLSVKVGVTQGIGFHDGYYEDWEFSNNLLVVDHYNAIVVRGAIDSEIRNNLVLDPNNDLPGPSWYIFRKHKNGDPTVNSVISGNYGATRFIAKSSDGVAASDNVGIEFADYDQYFVDHENYDYRVYEDALPFRVGAKIDENKLAPEPYGGDTSMYYDMMYDGPAPKAATSEAPQEVDVDTDADGVADSADNCPAISNSDQKDVNGNGVGDVCDIRSEAEVEKVEEVEETEEKVKEVEEKVEEVEETEEKVKEVEEKVEEVEEVKEKVEEDSEEEVEVKQNDETPNVGKVQTTSNLNVRKSPNGERIGMQPLGSQGIKKTGPTVRIGSYDWVYVNFDSGVDGYVAQQYLRSVGWSKPVESEVRSRDEVLLLIKQLLEQIAVLRARIESMQR